MHANITAAYITKISKLAPATEEKHIDLTLRPFHIRQQPSGRLTFNVQLQRKKSAQYPAAVALGEVATWESVEQARTFAQKVLTAFNEGKPLPIVKADKPAKADAAKLSVLDVLGLRADEKSGRPDVPGLYRTFKRKGTKRIGKGDIECLIDRFVLAIGPAKPFAELTQADIKRWLAQLELKTIVRTGGHRSPKTLHRSLCDVRTVFNWALGEKLIAVNPCHGIKIDLKRTDKVKKVRWLSPEEEAALRDALDDRDAREKDAGTLRTMRRDGCKYVDHLTPLVLLALNTGGRKGALFQLRWYHIELVPSPMVCFEGKYQKSGQTYYVPANQEVMDVLAAWKPADAKQTDLIFPGQNGKPLTACFTAWETARDAAGLINFRFHDLRHTFASKLAMRSAVLQIDLHQISQWMGHASIKMTQIYAHLCPRAAAGALDLINVPIADLAEMRAAMVAARAAAHLRPAVAA